MNPPHPCPAPNCNRMMPFHILACERHWHSLPLDIRSKVTRTWRRAPLSPEYMEARAEAVAWLEEKFSKREEQNG